MEGARPAEEPRWAAWARQAAERARESAAVIADQAQNAAAQGMERARSIDWEEKAKSVRASVSDGLEVVKDKASVASESLQEKVSHGVEKAKSVDWDEQTRGLRNSVSSGLETASASASSATASLQEKGKAGFDVVREKSRDSVESLHLTETFTKAKDGASAAAGAATGALTSAGGRLSNISAITISPKTWAQFAAVFSVGMLFIFCSLASLPTLLIHPQKFAITFTLGSITLLSSFVIFSGPKALVTSMTQRDKLPFSTLYVIGLIGTLWATLFLKSYVLTAIFALTQATALLYFMASYLPGGKATVNMCCGLFGRSARTLMQV